MPLAVVVVLALSAAEPAPVPDAAPAARESAQPPPVAPPHPGRRPPSAPPPRVATPLLDAHRGALVVTASSTWTGWGTERLVDGDVATSWFSARGDAAALGQRPWVALRFPVDVAVRRVALLGNREPSWPKGFSIHYGQVELLDADGRVLATKKNEAKNTKADIDFAWPAPVTGVRTVRFTSLMDDGDRTQFQDVAFAELLVE